VSSRPRLLFVSPRFLFPLDQGGKIRTANILRHMKGGALDITLASPAPTDAARFADDVAGVCDRFLSWPEATPSKFVRALSLLGALPVAVASDRSAAGSRLMLATLADQPDIVLVDFPHAGVLLPARLDVASVMFTHNVEAEIFERHAELAAGPMRRIWRSQAAKMRRFEGDTLRRFNRVIAVSARDAAALSQRYALADVAVIDTGVDLDFFAFRPPPQEPSSEIVFTGTMSWPANAEGIAWLMDEIWPLVVAARPDARAVIVGRGAPEALVMRAKSLNWRFTGFVDDIRPHVGGSQVYVIPLRVGSGTRIKAFEALAMGRPVVSTTIGIEGLDITDGLHFLAADTAEQFAGAILRLLGDAPLRDDLAHTARALVEEKFSWSHVARQFEGICLTTLARSRDRNGLHRWADVGEDGIRPTEEL